MSFFMSTLQGKGNISHCH